ncbi:hypothetical protein B7R54_06525 [Subtercola boreus]|uniref:Secreted protein n=1 Tax=Subtercola boreus TaxID=120213 RepID=A0A3E0VJ87_9MICO|nr:hypothetical protein B7R54_06525 [Subtercola boreus]
MLTAAAAFLALVLGSGAAAHAGPAAPLTEAGHTCLLVVRAGPLRVRGNVFCRTVVMDRCFWALFL